MTLFKPTHRLDTGTLVELEHCFIHRLYKSDYGLFHFEQGGPAMYPMSQATEIPKVIQVAAHEEPEPLRVAPEVGSTYWVLDPWKEGGVRSLDWSDSYVDHRILAAGEARATKEDAIAADAARQKARGFA